MLTISLCGGLGNQLFQLAALQTISRQSGRKMYLESFDSPLTCHSDQKYFDSILSQWKSCPQRQTPCQEVHETSYEFRIWKFGVPIVKLCGYFQNYQYISEDFVNSIVLPDVPILQGAFLHIRGGDYVNHPLHDVHLEDYYTKAISLFPKDTHFYIFTNDIVYAKTLSFLNTIHHTIVEESDEVKTLTLLKNCTLGGICANSTFSWWGAYLNRNHRILVLPSKWFNTPNIYIKGYFFPGSTIIEV